MRLFVALNLPASVRADVYASVAPLRALDLPVRWVEPDQLHVTLKFLGAVGADHVAAVAARISAVAGTHEPFSLRIGGIGAFPTLRRPRVIWAGVHAPDSLRMLHAALDAELEALGFAREDRPFRPHLTLGRVLGNERAPDLSDPGGRVGARIVERTVTVRTIDLMRSTLGSRGAQYDRITASALGVAAKGDGGTGAS